MIISIVLLFIVAVSIGGLLWGFVYDFDEDKWFSPIIVIVLVMLFGVLIIKSAEDCPNKEEAVEQQQTEECQCDEEVKDLEDRIKELEFQLTEIGSQIVRLGD